LVPKLVVLYLAIELDFIWDIVKLLELVVIVVVVDLLVFENRKLFIQIG